MLNSSRQRRPQLPTAENPNGSDEVPREKDNPHDLRGVTLNQRIQQ
jgi:hypothetical protein